MSRFSAAVAHLNACHAAFLAHGYARTSDSKRRMFADHARRCALWGPEWHDEAMRIASLMIECTKVAHRVSYVEPEARAAVEPVAPAQSAPEALDAAHDQAVKAGWTRTEYGHYTRALKASEVDERNAGCLCREEPDALSALECDGIAPKGMIPDGYKVRPCPNAAMRRGGYTHEAFSPNKAARNGLSSLGYYRNESLAFRACCDHAARGVAMVANPVQQQQAKAPALNDGRKHSTNPDGTPRAGWFDAECVNAGSASYLTQGKVYRLKGLASGWYETEDGDRMAQFRFRRIGDPTPAMIPLPVQQQQAKAGRPVRGERRNVLVRASDTGEHFRVLTSVPGAGHALIEDVPSNAHRAGEMGGRLITHGATRKAVVLASVDESAAYAEQSRRKGWGNRYSPAEIVADPAPEDWQDQARAAGWVEGDGGAWAAPSSSLLADRRFIQK